MKVLKILLLLLCIGVYISSCDRDDVSPPKVVASEDCSVLGTLETPASAADPYKFTAFTGEQFCIKNPEALQQIPPCTRYVIVGYRITKCGEGANKTSNSTESLQCIEITCIKPAPRLCLPLSDQMISILPLKTLQPEGYSLDGSCLRLFVHYSGCCRRTADFQLHAQSVLPHEAYLDLVDHLNGPTCEMLVSDTLSFDLEKLHTANHGSLKLHIGQTTIPYSY